MHFVESDQVVKIKLLPPSADNLRNSEGSIIQLTDGRLLLAYTHYYGKGGDGYGKDAAVKVASRWSEGGRPWSIELDGVQDDCDTAIIAGRFSEDDGRTWSKEDITLVENEGKCNVIGANLLRLASGEIAIFYRVINSEDNDMQPYMRISRNQGKTWEDRVRIVPRDGVYKFSNDRVIQLFSGRLVAPICKHYPYPNQTMCFLSDDNGATWRRSKTVLELPRGSKGCLDEPGVVELKDGSIMMLMRTLLGGQFRSYSHDGGETWTTAEFSGLEGVCSPAAVKRIPGTGDILAVWNTPSTISRRPLVRSTLSTAISKDEGKSWQNIKTLEYDPDGDFAYVSLLFVKDIAVMSYWCRHNKLFPPGGGLLALTLVNIDWFYK